LLVALAAPGAFAQAKPAPAPVPAPAPKKLAAIEAVSDALTKALGPTPVKAVVVSAGATGDVAIPRAAELGVAIASIFAGRRGPANRAKAETMTLPNARVAAHGEGALIYLTPTIGGGKLRVAADVYPVPKSVWARLRNPEPGAVAHAFAEVPIDAEIRAFLAPVPILGATLSVQRARNFESDVVALACGDVDGDGLLEIVSVSRRRVTTLRFAGGKVQPLHSRNWPDLSPVAASPLREPIGFASIVTRGDSTFVDVGITDRSHSVRLDGALETKAQLGGLAVPDGDSSACTRLTANLGLVVTGAISPCSAEDSATFAPTIGGRYDAFASTWLATPKGEPQIAWAGREDRVLELRDDRARAQRFDVVGAQLAIGDLDQDGDPEILSSLDTLNPLDDAVVIRSWSRSSPAASALRDVAKLPAAAGVHALGVCPPDSSGRAAFVVATADEIWVVR
jgi:hypothetical protein